MTSGLDRQKNSAPQFPGHTFQLVDLAPAAKSKHSLGSHQLVLARVKWRDLYLTSLQIKGSPGLRIGGERIVLSVPATDISKVHLQLPVL